MERQSLWSRSTGCESTYRHERTHVNLSHTLTFISLTWKTCRSRGKKKKKGAKSQMHFFFCFLFAAILFGFGVSVSEFLIFPPSHATSPPLCGRVCCLCVSDSHVEHNPPAAVEVCSSLPPSCPLSNSVTFLGLYHLCALK